jgi:epsin
MEEYKQILGILARRLHSEPNAWRQVYKSLLLLEYMAKNGPQRIIPELKSNGRVFTRLQKFEYIDDEGKDQGLNVRNRYAMPIFFCTTASSVFCAARRRVPVIGICMGM